MQKSLLILAPLISISTLALAQTVSVPGGTITIDESGDFSGTISDISPVEGYPDESEITHVSGTISPDGSITGEFSGVATYNVIDESESVVSVSTPYSGEITGTISDGGDYTVDWNGSEPGSDSGNIPGFSLPSASVTTSTVAAYSTSPEFEENENTRSDLMDSSRTNIGSIQTIEVLAKRLTDISLLCTETDVYAIDCIAERLERLSYDMRGLSGHGNLRKVIRQTASQLHAVARNNRDTDRRKATVRTADGSLRSSRALVPVSADRQAEAISRAVAIIEEAETSLLRSAPSSSDALNFQRIADALGSNKVLLRAT